MSDGLLYYNQVICSTSSSTGIRNLQHQGIVSGHITCPRQCNYWCFSGGCKKSSPSSWRLILFQLIHYIIIDSV